MKRKRDQEPKTPAERYSKVTKFMTSSGDTADLLAISAGDPCITSLDLSFYKFNLEASSLLLNIISQAGSLQRLNLNHTKFEGDFLTQLALILPMSNIQHLQLAGQQLSERQLDFALRVIKPHSIKCIDVTTEGISPIALPSLIIFFCGTSLTDIKADYSILEDEEILELLNTIYLIALEKNVGLKINAIGKLNCCILYQNIIKHSSIEPKEDELKCITLIQDKLEQNAPLLHAKALKLFVREIAPESNLYDDAISGLIGDFWPNTDHRETLELVGIDYNTSPMLFLPD